MPNPLLKGPFTFSRWTRPAVGPGEALVMTGRQGLVVVPPSQGISPGEARFSKGSYWRVVVRSPIQTIAVDVPSRTPRDMFRVELHYVVEVTEAGAFYENTTADVDPLAEIQAKIRNGLRTVAARFGASELGTLQETIPATAFDVPEYLRIHCMDVVVDLTAETKARLAADVEAQDEMRRLERLAAVGEKSDRLEHEKRQRREQQRYELVTGIAGTYGLRLDPLMLRALALDESPSPDTIFAIRERLASERFEDLQRIGDFFQSLHERDLLRDEAFAALMDFAEKIAIAGSKGMLRQPSLQHAVREIDQGPVIADRVDGDAPTGGE